MVISTLPFYYRQTHFSLLLKLLVLNLLVLFFRAEFTNKVVTPALGVSGVGGAMAIYGAADAIVSA